MKSALAALLLLASISGFCFWNSRTMAGNSAQWQEDLAQASTLVREAHWQEARAVLRRSYQSWTRQQTYLRIISNHAVLEEAEELYRRSLAYADTGNSVLLLAVLSHLDDQLQLLSDREGLSLTNIF